LSKRGRPPNHGVERYRNGEIKADRGAPGLLARRLQALESAGAERDFRTENPLSLILARALIRPSEHSAGVWYASLHFLNDPFRRPQSCITNLVASGPATIGLGELDDDPKRAAERKARYLRCRDALKAAGAGVFRAVHNIVIYGHWPRFLDIDRRRTPDGLRADKRELEALQSGLDILARELGMRAAADEAPAIDLADSIAALALARAQRLTAEAAALVVVVPHHHKRRRR
jgi:hypothetical protein